MITEFARLVKNEKELKDLVLPLVRSYCESTKHKDSEDEVAAIIMDIERIHCFVFMNESKAVGFTTCSITNAFGLNHLHQWHGYIKPEYRHLNRKLYDLVQALVEDMKIDRVSFNFFTKKVAKRVTEQLKARGINLKFVGYSYLAKQKE